MKFEFAMALKYLLPRKERLSASFVSLFSIGTIALVVWLSVVFLSVIGGIEKRWIQDLSKLHSPIKICPSENYYSSYYYNIDSYSEKSNYSLKTLGEKLSSAASDPYDQDLDEPLPEKFPSPDLAADGALIDPVKVLYKILSPIVVKYHGEFQEFEESYGQLILSEKYSSRKEEDLRGFSRLISYDLSSSQRDLLLPYSSGDYLSFALSPLNLSSSEPRKNFIQVSAIFAGKGVVLPKRYAETGYQVGDTGSLSFYRGNNSTPISLPVVVTGFYNPGLSPIGGKTIFVDKTLAETIRDTTLRDASPQNGITNGFDLFFPQFKKIEKIKQEIRLLLKAHHIDHYWHIDSLYDYEQFLPILEQLSSDKILFLLVSFIILFVACSNVVTMLILLVNDKKKEIGILIALGASKKQLKRIFGICGAISGGTGAFLGVLLAIPTLKYLEAIVNFLGGLQGHAAFNKQFFGNTLPNQIDNLIIAVIGIATLVLATISGIIPSIKVAKMQASEILKSE
ncbi:ABC transporter permease [Chlamydiifrater phoenicopteri]|uniref:ABC transporter permease n=1 Tax=Chlamydiifrater phoenicopteri TaxID=2681469 RepID=UPI001BCF7E6E|nr:FtsX-like permease family protein [Chlamydiifrater phoenicopteri]